MKWERGHKSDDVIIRQGGQSRGGGQGSGLVGLVFQLLTARFGWVGAVIGIGAIMLYNGVLAPSVEDRPADTAEARSDPRVQMVSFVLDDVQDTWTALFAKSGKTYRRAKMVVYEGSTSTGCGYGDAATGPFYCPLDERVYLDLSFFEALQRQLGAPGDFAQAYVIGHEVGHHVQNQLFGMKGNRSAGEQGESVKVELQADCYAGVWAASTQQRKLLEAGDIEEAIGAASAVGDDRLEQKAGKPVRPERWTHGSAKSRAEAFQRGLKSGDPATCGS